MNGVEKKKKQLIEFDIQFMRSNPLKHTVNEFNSFPF